eukprot:2059728-Rhodomonas_salina.1
MQLLFTASETGRGGELREDPGCERDSELPLTQEGLLLSHNPRPTGSVAALPRVGQGGEHMLQPQVPEVEQRPHILKHTHAPAKMLEVVYHNDCVRHFTCHPWENALQNAEAAVSSDGQGMLASAPPAVLGKVHRGDLILWVDRESSPELLRVNQVVHSTCSKAQLIKAGELLWLGHVNHHPVPSMLDDVEARLPRSANPMSSNLLELAHADLVCLLLNHGPHCLLHV